MAVLIRFTLLCLMAGSALAQSSLPACQGDVSRWNNCFGSVNYPSGNKYIGEYAYGMRNGQGTYFYLAGNKFKVGVDKYIGEFKNDMFNGQGTLISNGYTYVGSFKDDKRHGQGIQYKSDGTVIASGDWSGNKLDYSIVFDINRFPINSPTINASVSNFSNLTDRDRLVLEVEAERKKTQELEQQLASNRERDRITAELDAERSKRQELQAELDRAKELAESRLNERPNPLAAQRSQRRVALIIGNAQYKSSPLENSVNDATRVS